MSDARGEIGVAADCTAGQQGIATDRAVGDASVGLSPNDYQQPFTATQTGTPDPVAELRVPELHDASKIVRLVRESGALDLNSDYAYLLMCHHFSDTCLVAEIDDRIVGFTLGYRPPGRTDTLFIWQIGVCATARGAGLGGRMLDELLRRQLASGVRFVEATVTPSNAASQALFESLARRCGVACEVTSLFSSEMFSTAGAHEAEQLYRIGPLSERSIGSRKIDDGS